MIDAFRARVRRHWPRLRLRTILLATLLFVAALPGVGAVFLRVYENTLVRQTESELVAQGAALAATAAALWPGAVATPLGRDYRPEPPGIDLSAAAILPERPAPVQVATPPDPRALAAARRLRPIAARTSRTTLASIMLLDASGRIVIGPGLGGSLAALPEVATARAGQPRTMLRRNGDYRQRYAFEWLSRAAAIRVHHARPVLVDGRVVGTLLLSRSARGLFRGLYEDRGKILLGIAAIFATLVALTALLSRGIARPIEALSAATRDVAAGRGDVPPPPPTAAIEIQDLYRNFSEMAAAIELRSRYLRDFAHAVSHEFKTPLAGIAGAIELLQDHHGAMTEPERRQFLANAAADADRLAQLVTRLLDLARADMARPEAEAVTDLADAAARIADGFRGPAFAIQVEIAAATNVAIPASVIEAVLASLVENSRQAGAANVRLSATPSPDIVTLELADDGPGIAAGDRARIFEPFFTSRRAEGGTGLGLAIVRSLLDASRATIALAPSDAGTTFVLTLPSAR